MTEGFFFFASRQALSVTLTKSAFFDTLIQNAATMLAALFFDVIERGMFI